MLEAKRTTLVCVRGRGAMLDGDSSMTLVSIDHLPYAVHAPRESVIDLIAAD